MISSLLFTSLSSERFGQDPRRWRFFADAVVDVGILCEMLAGSVFGQSGVGALAAGGAATAARRHTAFIALLCLGSVCKALCGVAANSANSAIAQHFSRGGLGGRAMAVDIGEVAAKGGAVGTVSGLSGLLLSLALARATAGAGRRSASLANPALWMPAAACRWRG